MKKIFAWIAMVVGIILMALSTINLLLMCVVYARDGQPSELVDMHHLLRASTNVLMGFALWYSGHRYLGHIRRTQ